MRSRRVHQLSVLLCAISWFLVGLMLGDVVDSERGPSRLQLFNLVLVSVLGLAELTWLVRGRWKFEPEAAAMMRLIASARRDALDNGSMIG
jgi:hypothetical protein